jgi:predicted hydrocarbon binding protein
MYRLDKTTRIAKVNCKYCKKDIEFSLPKGIIDNQVDFPVSFRYIHGNPIHSLTVFLDKQEMIRGVEFNQALSISPDVIDTFMNAAISEETESKVFIRTMMTAFTTVINIHANNADEILRNAGEILGETYAYLFKADNPKELLNSIANFWQRNNLGNIENIVIQDNLITFDVKECFECSNMGNIGRTVCFMDEGFFRVILEMNLDFKYLVKEYKCIANGDPCCSFKIEKIEEKQKENNEEIA